MKNFIAYILLLVSFVSYSDVIPQLAAPEKSDLNIAHPTVEWGTTFKGQYHALMLFVDFDNLSARNNPKTSNEIANQLLGFDKGKYTISEYYTQQSFGQFDYHVDVDHQWIRLDKKRSQTYPDSRRPVTYIRDTLIKAQDKGHQLSEYDIVYIVAPKGMRRNSPTHFLSADELPEIKNPPKVYVTFGDDGQASRLQHAIHETGHGMGMPDLYLYSKDQETPVPVGPWDVMGNNWTAVYFSAWTRHIWQWLGNKRKMYFKAGAKKVTISPIDASDGIAMVVIPSHTFPKEVIVIENPRPWKESVSKGIMIYRVNSMVPRGKGPMKIELPSNATDVYAEDALWQPGQAYYSKIDGVRIEILESVATGFIVRVSIDKQDNPSQ